MPMSLMAWIATPVSAYAVSSSRLAPSARPRSWAAARVSIPVIRGIRWSTASRATGRSRRASSASTSRASSPEVARTML